MWKTMHIDNVLGYPNILHTVHSQSVLSELHSHTQLRKPEKPSFLTCLSIQVTAESSIVFLSLVSTEHVKILKACQTKVNKMCENVTVMCLQNMKILCSNMGQINYK